MELVRRFLKKDVPKYLMELPLPSTWSDVTGMSKDQWIFLSPLIVTVLVLVLTIFFPLFHRVSHDSKKNNGRCNQAIDLKSDKVVHKVPMCDIEDILKGGKECVAYCRCWKSKKFPFCDGSHGKHNKETGDNVGPLLITK